MDWDLYSREKLISENELGHLAHPFGCVVQKELFGWNTGQRLYFVYTVHDLIPLLKCKGAIREDLGGEKFRKKKLELQFKLYVLEVRSELDFDSEAAHVIDLNLPIMKSYFFFTISDNEASSNELIGLLVDMCRNEMMMAAFFDLASGFLAFFRGKSEDRITGWFLNEWATYPRTSFMFDFESGFDLVEALVVEIDISECLKVDQQFNNSV